MLNLRPLGSTVRLEKQLTRSDAAVRPLGVFASDGVNVDTLLPGERLPEARAALHRRQCIKDIPHHAAPDGSALRVSSFAFLFVGLLCAAAFASEIRPIDSNSPDYGYDEALVTEMSPPLSAEFFSNCSDHDAGITGRSKDRFDRLGIITIVARGAPSSAANLHAKARGGNHVE
jgi:hypothetical protein